MHGSDTGHRATAVSLMLGALGCGALLFALVPIGFSRTTGEALRTGGPALAAVIVLWAGAAWVELWRRAAGSGRRPRRGALTVRAFAAACVALGAPATALALPSLLGLAALVIGGVALRRLLRLGR